MARYLDLPTVLAAVRTRGWLLALVALLAAGVAVGVSLARPKRYEASAHLVFGDTTRAASVAVGVPPTAPGPNDQATDVALASLDSVAARVKRRVSGRATVDDLRSQVRVMPLGDSGVFAITARSSSPRQAAVLANAFAEAVVALRRRVAHAEVQRAIDTLSATISREDAARAPSSGGAPAPATAQVRALRIRLARLDVLRALRSAEARLVGTATPPSKPSSPRTVHDALKAAFAGLLLGLPLMLLASRLDQRIRNESELVALVPAAVLARIPEARSKRPWTADQSRTVAEAFDLLRMNLQLMRPEGRSVVAAVTSPADGDGKSTTVARLAESLASSGAHVMVVDFDLRRPMLHTWFDVPRSRGGGVLGALLEPSSHHALTQPVDQARLQVLPAGSNGRMPPGFVGHERVHDLLGVLRRRAEYVLVDTSPVSTVADTSVVAAAADGVILVVDLATVRRRQLVAARRQLANAHATILGIVVNRAAADGAQLRP